MHQKRFDWGLAVLQASGLADLEHSPSVVLFDALQKRAKDIDADFSEEQKKELKTAFEKLGYADKL